VGRDRLADTLELLGHDDWARLTRHTGHMGPPISTLAQPE
jgi:hypothetical protein